ncbi:MAG: ATP-binding protein [Candidatus Muirbacterium halophilum]|nr:ATP-binding protein [Candidatus Muirbacterium halophilum]
MKKLPIGISTLEKIINNNYVYIDKTKIALELIENGGGYYFLSRPRRFGKSLFLDTLKEIFYGNKELFKGLHIYDKYDFEKYPVIRISFNDGGVKCGDDLKQFIREILEKSIKELDLNISLGITVRESFNNVIIETFKKYNQRVVILIDEYDKPILDNIDDKEIAKEIRDELKNFYSVIKGADEYLKFVFLTGVSKFSKVSLFSGLNNLNDITLNPNFSTICGYTQSELEESFKEHLKGQDLNEIRQWYNGYKWLGDSVYNPFDILLFISNNFIYENYWFSTATPTFLLKLIDKYRYYLPDLENIKVDNSILESFDVDNIKLETLMWQTGYLTIDKTENLLNKIEYILKMPNREIEMSLLSSVAEYMTKSPTGTRHSNNMLRALLNKNMEEFETSLKALFASIAYNNFTNSEIHKYEGYYISVFYAYIKSFGVDIKNEDSTNGRIDITIMLPDTIYLIEFKIDDKHALDQIKEKKYYEKFLDTDKEIILIGIEFSTEERNVVKIESERCKASGNLG